MGKTGECAVGQVLEMLQKRDPMGIDTRLDNLMRNKGGRMKAKYKVLWAPDGIQRTELPGDLKDNRGSLAASRHILRIPLAPQDLSRGLCQDDKTSGPQDAADPNVRIFYHGTPLLSVPSILAFGLKASRRSHGYVGLWCRTKLDQALSWCTCPEVQHFPCVALELAAWKQPKDEGTETGEIKETSRTQGAACILVSGSEVLPPVALRAIWVAMPRSHVHFQRVSQLHAVYQSTIIWVAKETDFCLHRPGRKDGTTAGTLAGHLAQLTERRLVYWGLGGEIANFEKVPWPHKTESNGLLALSHACARCIRVATGDEEGGKTWPWDNVPHPFRDWLEMRGKGKSHFLTTIAGDQICPRALSAWGDLRKHRMTQTEEPHLILPAADEVAASSAHAMH